MKKIRMIQQPVRTETKKIRIIQPPTRTEMKNFRIEFVQEPPVEPRSLEYVFVQERQEELGA